MKKIIILFLILFSSFNQKAFSCQCKEYKKDSLLRISYEVSEIVFLGELISTDFENHIYQFKIYETFKGNDSIEFVTYTPMSSCSLYPYPDGLWLIYASFIEGDTIDIDGCLASKSFVKPVVFPPDPPFENNEQKKTLEQEIEILKRDLEREKIEKEALTDLIIDLEKLRYLKKSSANKL